MGDPARGAREREDAVPAGRALGLSQAAGFYRPGDGWLHRLHPVPKLLLLVWAMLAPFALPVAAIPAVIVLVVAAALTASLGTVFLRRLLLAALPIVAAIVVVNALFFPGATVILVRIGPMAVTGEGLAFGLRVAGRLVAALAAVVAFSMTTRPDDLMTALVARGVDPRLAFVVLSALQAIPRTATRARRIVDAQRSRGLPTAGSPAARIRAVLPLLGPLGVATLLDARDRSLALEARGFSRPGPRTTYRTVEARPVDGVVTRLAAILIAALAILAVARLVGWLP